MNALPVLPVLLWTDALIWLLVAGVALVFWRARRQPLVRAAFVRVGQSRPGMAAATVLAAFIVVGLLDSLHYRPPLAGEPGQKIAYAVEVRSLLDALAQPLRARNEKTYSAPLATRAYAKETIEVAGPDGRPVQQREFPRLRHGGKHLADEADWAADVLRLAAFGLGAAALIWCALAAGCVARLARRAGASLAVACRRLACGETDFAWNAVLVTLAVLLAVFGPLLALSSGYHVFGTDKVGQSVFYQVLKSVRTGLVIGLVTTLVMLPLSVLLGVLAGYFRGWVDDAVQYLYTTLSSIPGVLLIAAAVLMMQVLIDTHPEWFSTAAERADMRLLALCFILGLTSWTGLCRLLRGETLKLRELEYIQAAQAFGVSNWRIIIRHILPNLMHIVIIALVMDFSGLVLAEAVLSYVGIGVDPTMISFGTMINNARMELAREPMVWWSLAAAFVFMFTLVLAANLLADAVRDAFDPRRS